MGGGASKPDPLVIDYRHFTKERVLGKGGFGKVNALTKKTQPNANKMFAIKEIDKMTVIKRNAHEEIFSELAMLTAFEYPLICNSHYAFQDEAYLYLVLDLALGGDLRYRLNQLKKKNPNSSSFLLEAEIRYYAGAVLFSLNYLHRKKIVYRDLKPDNMLLQEGGYMLLTDFGISKFCPDGICNARSGTHGYMAPEVYKDDGKHTFNSDFFALGVLIFEFAKGTRPFTQDQIKGPPADVVGLSKMSVDAAERIKSAGYSNDMADFAELCMRFDPNLRPATCEELLQHPWLKEFCEADFTERKAPTFFKPDVTVANCDTGEQEMNDMFGGGEKAPTPKKEAQDAFKSYYFNIEKSSRSNALIESLGNPAEVQRLLGEWKANAEKV